MKEKLIIRNFGPIKDVELDLGRFNILIGEQATGKSTVAKVLAVCRYFSYIIGNYTIVSGNDSSFSEGLHSWGLKDYIKNDSYIHYQCKNYTVTAEYTPEKRQEWSTTNENGDGKVIDVVVPIFTSKVVPLSDEFKNLLAELEKIKPKAEDFIAETAEYDFGFWGWTIPTSFFLNDVKNVMDNPFYFPTQRALQSIFSLGQSSIQNISDSLFNQFARLDQIARMFKKETFIEPLNIYYINRDGHGFIRKANESQYYSLYNAASGYQAIIPIVLVIKYYNEIKKKSKTFLIEEPELDVFPTTQNKLIQYLSEQSKIYDSMILLTTHSPYTLTSVNNLIYAYQVGQKHSEKVAKQLNKKYWINPNDVSAYMLIFDSELGGIKQENIIDNEGLIKAEKIDGVSKAINKEFNDIMDIELGVDETAS